MIRHALSWMDDRVHSTTIQGLRDAWRGRTGKTEDTTPAWLGLAPEEAREGDALQTRLSALLDGVEGDDVATLTARIAEHHRIHPVAVDALELGLARRSGTDMLAALCVAYELLCMVPPHAFLPVVRGPAKRASLVVGIDGDRVRMTIPLSTEASWKDGTLTIGRVLPNTFQIAVLDKPLRTVVSHPLLDPLDLVITDIEIAKGRETRLRTSHVPEMVPAIALRHADLASDESALDTPPPSRRAAKGDLVSPF